MRTQKQTECNKNIAAAQKSAGESLTKCFSEKTKDKNICTQKSQAQQKECDVKFAAMRKKLTADSKKNMDRQAKTFRTSVKRYQVNANNRVKRCNINLRNSRKKSTKRVNDAMKKKRQAEAAHDKQKRVAGACTDNLKRLRNSYKQLNKVNKNLRATLNKNAPKDNEVALGIGESDNVLTYVFAGTSILFALTTMKLCFGKKESSVDTPLLEQEY